VLYLPSTLSQASKRRFGYTPWTILISSNLKFCVFGRSGVVFLLLEKICVFLKHSRVRHRRETSSHSWMNPSFRCVWLRRTTQRCIRLNPYQYFHMSTVPHGERHVDACAAVLRTVPCTRQQFPRCVWKQCCWSRCSG
jgi:hypothetical protein